ncbi:MAG: hypothetical protein QOH47_2412 [Sphingomonadales bacterium]|jgi:hypothetical protein|nr:hypothetical protein [Sphingomonadales bacterium]
MPDPVAALSKVLANLETALDGAAGLIETDRADDNPFENAELATGAINILQRRTQFEQHSQNEVLHRAQIDLDMIVAVEAASTNGARLREMEADIVAALWADRTLGGLAQDIDVDSSGGGEDVLCDEGSRPLSITILFLTPLGDHRTIIGAAGLVP